MSVLDVQQEVILHVTVTDEGEVVRTRLMEGSSYAPEKSKIATLES